MKGETGGRHFRFGAGHKGKPHAPGVRLGNKKPAGYANGGPLSAKQRDALPTSDFALPGQRKYPVNDPSHARNALARVSQFGTRAEKAKVRAKVHKKYPKIGKG